GLPVRAVFVTNREVANAELQKRGAEEEIEIAEWIKVAEPFDPTRDSVHVVAQKHLGAAEAVFDRLAQHVGKRDRKKFLPEQTQETHRLLFHWIHQATAVRELRCAGGNR